jgi:transcriptional regulator with XRE-family HTH domain
VSPKIDPKAFGVLVGRYREDRKLTQAALAEAVGVSRPYLTQIENGTRLPSDEVMEKLVILAGIPMQEFIAMAGPALNGDQEQALRQLLAPWDALTQQMAPEQMLGLTQSMLSIEQMAEAMAKLGGMDTAQLGPEGWAELTKEDRRLVQRIINRLRAGTPEGGED